MNEDEIIKLLEIAPEHRKLLYSVAFTTGLRASELRALTEDHLDIENCGLKLNANWTKKQKTRVSAVPLIYSGQYK